MKSSQPLRQCLCIQACSSSSVIMIYIANLIHFYITS
jgi:hypothetical protein